MFPTVNSFVGHLSFHNIEMPSLTLQTSYRGKYDETNFSCEGHWAESPKTPGTT